MKFGLYGVDLETKERIPRGSVDIMRRIIENKTVSGIG